MNDFLVESMQNVPHRIHQNVCVRRGISVTHSLDVLMLMNVPIIHALLIRIVLINKVDLNVYAIAAWLETLIELDVSNFNYSHFIIRILCSTPVRKYYLFFIFYHLFSFFFF